MKSYVHKLLVLGVMALVLISCKKDETRAVVQAGTAGTLSVANSDLTLTKASENSAATIFTFTPANFGYKAAVTYTLQFAKPNTNFDNPSLIQFTDTSRQQGVLGKALNIAALQAGLDTTSSQPIQVRLKADIGSGQAPVYSNVLNLNIKPYSLNSYMWVPGAYEGWSPGTAPRLISINSTGAYEGYVNFPNTASSYQFKFTSDPDWNHTNYGDGGGGTLSTTGNNLTVPGAGYYLLKANTNDNTWSATLTSWSLIGDFNGWSSDADMTYDPVNQVWTGTITAASAGGFKFRANHDWGMNFGDTGANGSLEYGGANISLPAGTHTITLDLHTPGAYTYSIQ